MKHPTLRHIRTLLTPSWLSGLVIVVVWLVVVVGGILSVHLSGSLWQKGWFHLGARSSATYQQLTARVSSNQFIDNLPLIIFWLGVGLIIYYVAVGVYEALHEAVEIHEELDYVNVRRQQLLRAVIEQLVVRFAALVVWFIYIAAFFKHLLPYVLAGLHQVSLQATSGNVEHAIWISLVLLIGLHVHTVLLRLMFLRERLFSSAVYDI